MTERKIYERFGNLSEDELNTKSNKNFCDRNDAVTLLNVVKVNKKKKN